MALKVAIALAAFAALLLLVAFLARREPRLPGDLQGAIDAAREHYKLPALAACVVTPDNINAGVSGVREAGMSAAVTLDDYWHIGSNGKAMTATLAAILFEAGEVDSDLKLADVFDFELHAGYRDVTLGDLLQHRSGLAPFTAGDEFDPVEDKVSTGTPTEQRHAFAKLLLTQPPAGEHGEYEYSNAGYGIAAAVLERKTGRAWEEVLQEKLCQPLGLHVRIGWPATAQHPDHPLGHVAELGGLTPLPIDDEYELPPALDPAGDFSLPIADYGKFLQLHLRGMLGQETLNAKDKPLLKPETIKLLHEPNGDYSYGWIEFRMFDLIESTHDGSVGTFYMTATIDVDSKVAVAVVANAGNPAAEQATHRVARRLLDAASRPQAGDSQK